MIVMMFWSGGGWAWWQAGLMWLAMIAFWGVLIWAIYALIAGARRGGTAERGERQPGDARAILDQRLARGEISPEEYRRLRDVLDGGTGRSPAGTGSGTGTGGGSGR
jgi:putative membrane protein